MGFSMKANLHIDSVEGSRNTIKVVVGYPDEMHRSGRSVADLAELLSEGDANIPARPHLEEGLVFGTARIKRALTKYLKAKKGRRDPDQIGEAMLSSVKAYIFSSNLERNAPSTIRKKGSEQPLVEVGDLVSSLTFKVLRGDN